MIRKRLLLFLKFILFIIITFASIRATNEMLKPKYYFNKTWSPTNTYLNFYKLKRDSVDVLFFGSSHAVCAFNPQVLYDNFGITSYNMGCEQQSLLVTYYWLKEALKYQSPKAVVLETYTFHKYRDAYVYSELNCSEASVRKPMDNMRLSPLKWEAACAIEKIDPSQDALSYIFPNIRYHTRWNNLTEDDYTEGPMVGHDGVKGHTVLGGSDPDAIDTVIKDSEAEDAYPEEMVLIADEYLEKISGLCRENGIELIYVNIPYGETVGRYKSTKDYAEKHGIPYYDFNEEKLYKEIQYKVSENQYDHPNYLGAEKLTMYMGRLLSGKYGIKGRQDSSFDKSREFFERRVENIRLESTTDINEYFGMLKKERYSIFLFFPRKISSSVDERMMAALYSIGIKTDLRPAGDTSHYFAVIDSGSITERLTNEDINYSGSVRNGLTVYNFTADTSKMISKAHTYSITIGGTNYDIKKSGLSIIVYDKELKKVADKINFSLSDEGIAAERF